MVLDQQTVDKLKTTDANLHKVDALLNGPELKAAKFQAGAPKPMDEDTPLIQPLDNWDEVDRRGPGKRLFFAPGDTRFKERYDLIDWSN